MGRKSNLKEGGGVDRKITSNDPGGGGGKRKLFLSSL